MEVPTWASVLYRSENTGRNRTSRTRDKQYDSQPEGTGYCSQGTCRRTCLLVITNRDVKLIPAFQYSGDKAFPANRVQWIWRFPAITRQFRAADISEVPAPGGRS